MHSELTSSKILFLLTFLVLSVSCSLGMRRFFFDGVPDPAAEKAKMEQEKAKENEKSTPKPVRKVVMKVDIMKSRHPDYRREGCPKCHDTKSSLFLTAEKEKLCFNCHKPAGFTGPFVHGPVAVNGCLFCHTPHESIHDNLLKTVGQALCFQCHKKEELSQGGAHNSPDIGNCSSCHAPHVSENKFFIREQR